jgi:Protein of unknown function (DUF4242)
MVDTDGTDREVAMPKYVIERELPGAGKLSTDELRNISQKSNSVIAELGPDVKWLQSYVTDDKIYCVYAASDEDIIQEHARCGGFPANRISKVTAVIDPSTGD